jgi:hypothetical protein
MPPKKQIKLAVQRHVSKKEKKPVTSDSEEEDNAVVSKLDQVDSDLESMDGDDEFSGAEEGSDNEKDDMEDIETECKRRVMNEQL